MKPSSNSTYLGGKGKTLTDKGKITRDIDRDLFGFEKKLPDDILKFKGTNKQRLLQRNKGLRGINKTGSSKDAGSMFGANAATRADLINAKNAAKIAAKNKKAGPNKMAADKRAKARAKRQKNKKRR
jgi:hypothetical protein